MKRIILPILASFLIVSPVHATPLTWHFFGTTSTSSQFNGMSIGGLAYELRIFLDTDLVAFSLGTFPDIEFSGPHQGEISITALGTLPLNPISRVLYHAPGGIGNPVTEVQFYAPFFNSAHFASSISNDSEHLSPIPLTATSSGGLNTAFPVMGPNGLSVAGSVTAFSATDSATAVPEGGSTALLLTSALVAMSFLRRRIRA